MLIFKTSIEGRMLAIASSNYVGPVQNDTQHLGASLPLARFCRRVRLYDKGSSNIEGRQKAVNRAGDGFGRIVRAGHLIDVLADADVDNAAVQIP